MKRLRPALLLALALTACPDDPAVAPDTSDTSDAPDTSDTPDAPDTSDVSDTDTNDTNDTRDTADTDTSPGVWPWPITPVTVPSGAWRHDLSFPDDPFLTSATSSNGPRPRWVKFLVFTSDPSKIHFQDMATHPTHFAFAKTLPMFASMDEATFATAAFGPLDEREVIVGHVLYPPVPWTASPGPFAPREVGLTLLGDPPYPPVVVDTLRELVAAHISADDDAQDPSVLYMPSAQQAAQGEDAASPTRWDEYAACYATGWAVGRLVASDDPVADFARGALTTTDIVLTDRAPDTLPPVAGLIARLPSSASSRTAAIARSLRAPFVHLQSPTEQIRVEQLIGHTVLLRASSLWDMHCGVTVTDLEGHLTSAHGSALAALAKLTAPHAQATTTATTIRPAVELALTDVATFGGLSAHRGLLERALPDHTDPAFAVSFSLNDTHLAPFADDIAALGSSVSPEVASELASLRAAIAGAPLPTAPFEAIRSTLLAAGLETTPLAVRLSTNFSALRNALADGLHASHLGCLGDDLDDDTVGPSACGGEDEQPLSAAIARTLAELWSLESFAYRRLGGLSEDDIEAGLLIGRSLGIPIRPVSTIDRSCHARVEAFDGGASSRSQTFHTQLLAWTDSAAAVPEVQIANIFSFGTYMSVIGEANTVEYGISLLSEAEYTATSALIETLQTAWSNAQPTRNETLRVTVGFTRTGDTTTFDHFAPSPSPSTERTLTPYLVPGPPVDLCIFQGEAGGILGNHRMKLRATLTHTAGSLDRTFLEAPLFTQVAIDGVTFDHAGAPSSFSGAFHEAPTVDQWGNPSPIVEGWVTGTGDDRTEWRLEATLPVKVAPSEIPAVTIADAVLSLTASYTRPKPEPGMWPDNTTTLDYVRLVACPEDELITPRHIPITREGTVEGITVDTRFYWPPAPTGATAGYTAPLAKWDRTVITGLTTTPITLRGYWSQTYRPGHHNFSEDFVFEPRLEDGVDPALIAELDAKNIAALLVSFGYETPTITAIGLDGKLRHLAGARAR